MTILPNQAIHTATTIRSSAVSLSRARSRKIYAFGFTAPGGAPLTAAGTVVPVHGRFRGLRLPVNARAVLSVLLGYVNEFGGCYPSRRLIAEEIGKSVDTVAPGDPWSWPVIGGPCAGSSPQGSCSWRQGEVLAEHG